MLKKLAAVAALAAILLPQPSFAMKRESPARSEAVTSQAGPEAGKDEGPPAGRQPIPAGEIDRRMKSADRLIMAGYILSTSGALAAVGGSIVAIAKKHDRVIGASVGAGGLALGVTGGLLTVLGYHKRGKTEGMYYSLAPEAAPGLYGLRFAMNF
ncbi:MAG: hypothetical protein V2A66_06525 [Pseudomonadota bacterium]